MTPRQKIFVDEYLVDMNATQAAIRAGYSARTAHLTGHRTLKNAEVADAIARRQKTRADRLGISADRVLKEYARIAFADIRDVDGVAMEEWSEDDAAAVSEIKRDGEGGIALKLHSKLHALDQIGKHLGMFVDRKEHTVRSIDDMSEAEIEALLGEDEETLN